jgi:hypothetical protein
VVPSNYEDPPWQQAGPTAFAPLPEDTTYFGDGGKRWMINFRVLNLEAMVAQLRSAGISVEIDSEPYSNGRFARLYDPQGNAIELWRRLAATLAKRSSHKVNIWLIHDAGLRLRGRHLRRKDKAARFGKIDHLKE